MTKKYLVVGAGLAGAVYARVLAEAGFGVDIIDKRSHIAGNCYDFVNDYGIRQHKYGAHIFHTSNERVVNWLGRFTEWTEYKHRVLAKVNHTEYHVLPINQDTQKLYSREQILDIFYRPYTKKMWGVELDQLSPKIVERVPIRDDDNDLYFPNDRFHYLPKHGYTTMFEQIFDHNNISVSLGTTFKQSMEKNYDHVFNCMAIDEYYDYCFGDLPYRSIKFQTLTLPEERIYVTSVVNFTTYTGPTRVIEWKNFPGHGQGPQTTLTYEYPCDYRENECERYYPVQDRSGVNKKIYERYAEIPNVKVSFIGRCGTYQYLDMHQIVSSSLAGAEKFIKQFKE